VTYRTLPHELLGTREFFSRETPHHVSALIECDVFVLMRAVDALRDREIIEVGDLK